MESLKAIKSHDGTAGDEEGGEVSLKKGEVVTAGEGEVAHTAVV
jgi:hypothetical protein